MLPRRLAPLVLGFSTGLALSSTGVGCIEPNPDHCYNNDGDAFCARKHPDWAAAYCTDNSCIEATLDGCVETPPPNECWYCDGKSGGLCEDTDTDTTTDTTDTMDTTDTVDTTETMDTSTDTVDTTGPMCTDDSECDGATPLCEMGQCVPCADAVSTSCAQENPELPACDSTSGQCVQCTEDDTSACSEGTPACVDQVCVPCDSHEQCPGSACHLEGAEMGSCFAGDAIHVDGDAPGCANGDGSEAMPVCSIQAGVGLAGALGVVIVHEAGGYSESVTIGGGSKIAFVGAPGESPEWRNGGSYSLLAQSGGFAYAHNLNFRASTSSAVVVSLSGTAYVTSSTFANSSQAAILVSDGTLILRNSFVGVQASFSAISMSAGTLDVAYSTIVGGPSLSSPGINCTGGSGTIRNSIVLTAGNAMDINNCGGLDLDGVFRETDSPQPFDELSPWFEDIPTGDFHLTGNPGDVFDAISTFATWTTGDPRTDIDGDPRMTSDGAMDFAGADVSN